MKDCHPSEGRGQQEGGAATTRSSAATAGVRDQEFDEVGELLVARVCLCVGWGWGGGVVYPVYWPSGRGMVGWLVGCLTDASSAAVHLHGWHCWPGCASAQRQAGLMSSRH